MSRRKESSLETRQQASRTAFERVHPKHISNSDEQKFRHDEKTDEHHSTEQINGKPAYLASYTKGLPHNYVTGLVENPLHFQYFVRAIDSGDFRDFRDTPLGHPENCGDTQCTPEEFGWKSNKAQTKGKDGGAVNVRAWESQSAGNSYDLEGPDAQAVTMPPAPALGSEELTAEMGEVYCQAVLRDTPFNAMSVGITNTNQTVFLNKATDFGKVTEITQALNNLAWFQGEVDLPLSREETARRRAYSQRPGNVFRGITPGDEIGPHISQFLLAGNKGINGNDEERSPADGLISYGAISIDQRVRVAAKRDYMKTWDEWFDVQNGADLRGLESYGHISGKKRRFIHTPRDLATYVHYDALYEAYLNACLMLLGNGTPFDPGIPFQEQDDRDHQQGFAHFGGPHILSLVTEVATRALKAVRFQKYNIHRRCRPEVLAARIYKSEKLKTIAPELVKMREDLTTSGILEKVATLNDPTGVVTDNVLLPMAFCEGSPMHPAYGAGHATVAGACVTILKAFFDHKHPLKIVPEGEVLEPVAQFLGNLPGGNYDSSNLAYVSVDNGNSLGIVPVMDQDGNLAQLTVEGELNKLASNIAIGRDWAGVHYFTDYYESILMGEQIALGILEEQKLTYSENFSMTVPLFNGNTIRI